MQHEDVEIYSYTGYPFLMDGSAMGWAIAGYMVLLLFAIMQAWVIGSVLISGLINRFRDTDNEEDEPAVEPVETPAAPLTLQTTVEET